MDQAYIRERVMVTPDGCWLWTLAVDRDGYGKACKGKAHRVAFEAFRGPIPAGRILDHVVCDQRSCVNPWHVEPSTHRENVLRSPIALCAINARKTHCPRGHPLSGDNLYLRPYDQARCCRTCRRESKRLAPARPAAPAQTIAPGRLSCALSA